MGNQNDVQQEPEQTLPIEGESQAKITDIHPINDQFKTGSVRNQSNIQSKQQRRESKKYKHVSEQKREKEKNVTDQLKYESVDNQNDGQQEQEHILSIQGGSPARITDTQPVNDQFKTEIIRNQSDTQLKQQMHGSKKYIHVNEQKQEEEKNVTDQLNYESVDHLNDGQQEQEKTLPIQSENEAKIVDIHSINDQSKIESVHNQSDTQLKQQSHTHTHARTHTH